MNIKKKLEKYLDENLYIDEEVEDFVVGAAAEECMSAPLEASACKSRFGFAPRMAKGSSINTFIDNEINENKFQKLLFGYIDKKGLKDSDVYNKANIDRRLFSKIRSNEDYHPSKETIIALASSLELSIDDLEKLLESASYSLPKNNKFDLIIRFCFLEKIYNILEINDLLAEHECQLI